MMYYDVIVLNKQWFFQYYSFLMFRNQQQYQLIGPGQFIAASDASLNMDPLTTNDKFVTRIICIICYFFAVIL